MLKRGPMKLISSIVLWGIAGAVLAQGHSGQQLPSGFGVLRPLVGTWGGKTVFNAGPGRPLTVDTILKITPIVQGHYLREDVISIIPDFGKRDFMNMLTYDGRIGVYKQWWFTDNSGNEPVRLEGHVDGNVLTFVSTNTQGPVFRNTFIFKSPTELTYSVEHKDGEKWIKQFTAEFTKKS